MFFPFFFLFVYPNRIFCYSSSDSRQDLRFQMKFLRNILILMLFTHALMRYKDKTLSRRIYRMLLLAWLGLCCYFLLAWGFHLYCISVQLLMFSLYFLSQWHAYTEIKKRFSCPNRNHLLLINLLPASFEVSDKVLDDHGLWCFCKDIGVVQRQEGCSMRIWKIMFLRWFGALWYFLIVLLLSRGTCNFFIIHESLTVLTGQCELNSWHESWWHSPPCTSSLDLWFAHLFKFTRLGVGVWEWRMASPSYSKPRFVQ